jgi:hypothetical protein
MTKPTAASQLLAICMLLIISVIHFCVGGFCNSSFVMVDCDKKNPAYNLLFQVRLEYTDTVPEIEERLALLVQFLNANQVKCSLTVLQRHNLFTAPQNISLQNLGSCHSSGGEILIFNPKGLRYVLRQSK